MFDRYVNVKEAAAELPETLDLTCEFGAPVDLIVKWDETPVGQWLRTGTIVKATEVNSCAQQGHGEIPQYASKKCVVHSRWSQGLTVSYLQTDDDQSSDIEIGFLL